MDLGSEGVSVYAEAKSEYTKQMCQYLVPALEQYFLDLLEEAKEKEPDAKKILTKFQDLLEAISEWNMDKVQRETTALTTATHCDYLEELLTAVFIAHTKVLSAIRINTRQKKLQITIPKLDHFLHRTLTECARILWSNTFLFSPSAPSIERQKNLRQIERLLTDGVNQAIRGMLPVKNILREYLKGGGGDDEEEEEEIEDEKEEEGNDEKEGESAPAEVKEEVSSEETTFPQEEPLTFTGMTVQESGATPVAPIDTTIEENIPAENELEELGSLDEIKILEGEGGEALDDFEDLDSAGEAGGAPKKKEDSDILPMDFEELS